MGPTADAGSSGEDLVMTPAVTEVSAWEYIFTVGEAVRSTCPLGNDNNKGGGIIAQNFDDQ